MWPTYRVQLNESGGRQAFWVLGRNEHIAEKTGHVYCVSESRPVADSLFNHCHEILQNLSSGFWFVQILIKQWRCKVFVVVDLNTFSLYIYWYLHKAGNSLKSHSLTQWLPQKKKLFSKQKLESLQSFDLTEWLQRCRWQDKCYFSVVVWPLVMWSDGQCGGPEQLPNY